MEPKSGVAISSIVSIVLIVIIVVTISLSMYIVINKIVYTHTTDKSLLISFSQDRIEGELLIVTVDSSIKWSDLKIEPDTVLINDIDGDGYIDGGEYLYNCTGKEVTIVYKPSNLLLGTWDFT